MRVAFGLKHQIAFFMMNIFLNYYDSLVYGPYPGIPIPLPTNDITFNQFAPIKVP